MSIKINIHQNDAKEAYDHLIKEFDLVPDIDFTVRRFVQSENIEFTFEDEKKTDAVKFKLLYG